MSRDYKPSSERKKSPGKGSPLMTGLIVGVLLGIAASLAVVVFIKGGDTPFTNPVDLTKQNTNKYDDLAGTPKDDDKTASNNPMPEADTKKQDEKTRFDFYTILPGAESSVTDEEIKQREAAEMPAVENAYFLQVGAFQTEDEANNMQAKLALQGFEAQVQTANIPEKGTWHRVRVGPLKDLEEINKARADLASKGFKADLIKVNNSTQQ